VCFGLQFLLIGAWRSLLVIRNKRRDKAAESDGLTAEDRIRRGKELGEQDATDFENPHVSAVHARVE
jgi:ACS family allantoate permease-like MFS transporter